MTGYVVVCSREKCGPSWTRCTLKSGQEPIATWEEYMEWQHNWAEEVDRFLEDCLNCERASMYMDRM